MLVRMWRGKCAGEDVKGSVLVRMWGGECAGEDVEGRVCW